MAVSSPRAQSHRLRVAESGDSHVAQFGGHPRGIRLQDWPRCKVCGAPMCHMFQLSAGPMVDLGPFQRATAFICHATGGRCEDWDPWKGANAVLLQRDLDDELYDGPHTVRVYRKQMLGVSGTTDEAGLAEAVRSGTLPVAQAVDAIRHDKLAGRPVWITGDATPQSRVGTGPMRLVAQVTTQITGFDITPKGIAYLFVDPHDTSTSAGVLLWQGG